ncbi:MAG: cell division protein FtsA [Aquificaceae bacterium]
MTLIAAVDLGSSKVVALIAEVDAYGELNVIGFGRVNQDKAIERGTITKLESALNAIQSALREAQEMAGVRVSSVVIGISGPSLKSQNEKELVHISTPPSKITQMNIDRVIERVLSRSREDSYEVISAIPRRYILDDQEVVYDPIGLMASKMQSEVHVIKSASNPVRNIENVLNGLGLEVRERFASPIASAEATLSQEDKEEGVLLIDFGAGLTSYCVYLEGSPLLTGSIPIGGINITRDIGHFMKVNVEQAERVKIEQGCALAEAVKEDEEIAIIPRGETSPIKLARRKIAEVIQIRLEEIAEAVREELNKNKIDLETLHAGIVLTGGSAKISEIKTFAERFFQTAVRVGLPDGFTGLRDRLRDPSYSTVIGLLKLARRKRIQASIAQQYDGKPAFQEKVSSFFARIKSVLREII